MRAASRSHPVAAFPARSESLKLKRIAQRPAFLGRDAQTRVLTRRLGVDDLQPGSPDHVRGAEPHLPIDLVLPDLPPVADPCIHIEFRFAIVAAFDVDHGGAVGVDGYRIAGYSVTLPSRVPTHLPVSQSLPEDRLAAELRRADKIYTPVALL